LLDRLQPSADLHDGHATEVFGEISVESCGLSADRSKNPARRLPDEAGDDQNQRNTEHGDRGQLSIPDKEDDHDTYQGHDVTDDGHSAGCKQFGNGFHVVGDTCQ